MSVNANKSLTNSNERIIGIDLVKIIAIFLVTLLHITGIGGAVDAADNPITKFLLSSIEGISFICINLFALSTGFLCYGRKNKLSHLFQLWFQVIFWALVANIGPAIFRKDLSILTETPFVRIFVISFCTYWYFVAYFALFFFMPLLNSTVEKITEKGFIGFFTVSAVVFGILPFLFNNDLYRLNKGYCVLWLAYLYILGAGFKKFNYIQRITKVVLCTVFLICAAVQSILTCASHSFSISFMGVNYSNIYEHYNFINTILLSTSLFLLVAGIKIDNKKVRKITQSAASSAFSVYLIQCNHSVMREFIENHMSFIGKYSPVIAVLAVFGIALAIYVSFSILGMGQSVLFKFCRIDKICDKAETLARKVFLFCYNKIYTKCLKN